MRTFLWISAVLALTACNLNLGEAVDVPLSSLGSSPVSGTAHLENAFCKSACVKINFVLSGGTNLKGEVRKGTCEAPGEALGGYLSTDPTFEETVSYVSDLSELKGKACVRVHDGAALEAGQTEAVVACGNIPE